MKRSLMAVLFFLLVDFSASAAQTNSLLPPARAKCPVCGMFVVKYPDWISSITFRDRTSAYFDGPKDMFTYYLNMKKYNPAKGRADIVAVQVKNYYDLSMIDAMKAFYVIGSDVYGPMGKELIPFRSASDANEFLKDHKGRKILRFSDINQELLKTLE